MFGTASIGAAAARAHGLELGRRLGLFGVGVAMALAAAGSAGAQWERPVDERADGALARSPVRFVERELIRECGPLRIPGDDVVEGDFTGDGVDDLILRLAVPCAGVSTYFCGSSGCATQFWVSEPDGLYRRVGELTANEAVIIPWIDGPAVQLDRGPVWVWDGEALDIARGSGAGGGAAIGRETGGGWSDPRASDGGWRNPDQGRAEAPVGRQPAPEPLPQPNVWRVVEGPRGGLRAVVDASGGESRLVVACRPGEDTLRLAVLPTLEAEGVLPDVRGAQVLIDVVVDGRRVETRLMTRREGRPGGPLDGALMEPNLVADGAILQALARGDTVLFREAGEAETIARFGLGGSRRSIDAVRDACGL